jgi:hypothetical protein
MFSKGQFTHICQLHVSCGQDSMSGIGHFYFFEVKLILPLILLTDSLEDTIDYKKRHQDVFPFCKY